MMGKNYDYIFFMNGGRYWYTNDQRHSLYDGRHQIDTG
jgi:hypothetical protein